MVTKYVLHCVKCNEVIREIEFSQLSKLDQGELCPECTKRLPEIAELRKKRDEELEQIVTDFKGKTQIILKRFQDKTAKISNSMIEMGERGPQPRYIGKDK